MPRSVVGSAGEIGQKQVHDQMRAAGQPLPEEIVPPPPPAEILPPEVGADDLQKEEKQSPATEALEALPDEDLLRLGSKLSHFSEQWSRAYIISQLEIAGITPEDLDKPVENVPEPPMLPESPEPPEPPPLPEPTQDLDELSQAELEAFREKARAEGYFIDRRLGRKKLVETMHDLGLNTNSFGGA